MGYNFIAKLFLNKNDKSLICLRFLGNQTPDLRSFYGFFSLGSSFYPIWALYNVITMLFSPFYKDFTLYSKALSQNHWFPPFKMRLNFNHTKMKMKNENYLEGSWFPRNPFKIPKNYLIIKTSSFLSEWLTPKSRPKSELEKFLHQNRMCMRINRNFSGLLSIKREKKMIFEIAMTI